MRKLIFAILIISAISLSGCGGVPYGAESEEPITTVTTTHTATQTTATAPSTTTTTSTVKRALMGAQLETTTEATTKMEDKTIELNQSEVIGTKNINFNSVDIDYTNELLIFHIEASKGIAFKYSSKDKNNNELETAYNATTIWVSKGKIEDYSTIYITCESNETDSVTVKIDIAGI